MGVYDKAETLNKIVCFRYLWLYCLQSKYTATPWIAYRMENKFCGYSAM